MTAPSYATALSTARAEPGSMNGDLGRQDQYEELYNPPPTSMPLMAALYLLDSPLVVKTRDEFVFVLPRSYLQNWILWAYHQVVSPEETTRLQRALRLAAEVYNLQAPTLGTTDYGSPAPIDNRILSDDQDPLLLRDGLSADVDKGSQDKDTTKCCGVSERFFEVRTSCLTRLWFIAHLKLLACI